MRIGVGESSFLAVSSRIGVLLTVMLAAAITAVLAEEVSTERTASEDALDSEQAVYEWVPILPRATVQGTRRLWLCSGPRGEIWATGFNRAIHRGHRARNETEWQWTRFEAPEGFQPRKVLPGAHGEVYVIGEWDFPSGSTVLLFREADGEWIDLEPPSLGAINDIAVTESGTVWVTGHWRNVHYLAPDGKWVREVTPLPLHNTGIKIFDDGSGWMTAHSRDYAALYHRKDGRWRVAAKSKSGGDSPLAGATKEVALFRTGDTLSFVTRPDLANDLPPREPIENTRGAITFSSLETGYKMEQNEVFRLQDGRWRKLRIVRAMQAHNLFDLGRHGLFATGRDGRLLQLQEATHSIRDDLLSKSFLGERPLSEMQTGRFYGLSVLRMAARDHLYLVNHVGPNLVIPLSSAESEPMVFEAVRSVSDRLGITGEETRNTWMDLYDTSAVVADLNADGREDIFVVNMYDEDVLYRNVRDRHFVSWQNESKAGGAKSDMTTGACALDADGDGDLDLYVTSIFAPDRLLLNNGAASFIDATDRSGMRPTDAGEAPRCVDLDGDGDADIVVTTFGRGLLIHENLGSANRGPRFRTHTLFADFENPDAGASLSTVYSAGIAAADLDADGLPEILLATPVGCDRLLWNHGEMTFKDRSDLLPPNQPCSDTTGAEFLDIDLDGDLDLMLTGKGGLRLYENDGGRFSWSEPARWRVNGRPAGRMVRGAVATDVDLDGDLDLFYGFDSGSPVRRENRTNGDRFIEIAIDGPAANRSAIGATVRLYPEGKAGISEELIAWRTVPPAGGYHSQGRRHAHFGGVEPGRAYDLVVDLPGAERRVVRGIVAPHIGRVALSADRLMGTALLWRATHFLGDPWHRLWVMAVCSLVVALIAFGWLLFAGLLPRSVWLAVFSSIPFSFVLLIAAPVDPGSMAILVSISLPLLFGILTIALLRARAVAKPLPELLVELDLALRAFQHNQTPRKVADRLRFVLENMTDRPVESGTKHSRFFAESLSAHRAIVLPELTSIARIARAASLLADEWKSIANKQAKLIAKMLSTLRQPESRIDGSTHKDLAASLERMDLLRRKTRKEVDHRLSIDLSDSLARYVVSRRGVVPCTVEVVDKLPEGLRVRFMKSELYRLLDILLENAIQAMESLGKPLVAIEAVAPTPHRARIVFQDRGPGISSVDAEAVFRAGYSKRKGGSGFGLFWARRTLERFGGSIRVATTDSGACFEVDFDVLRPAKIDQATEREP